MQKFTVFTVILSIVVIVIVADLVVNNYLPGIKDSDIVSELTSGKFTLPDSIDISKALETNVIGAGSVDDFTPNRLGFDLGNDDDSSDTELVSDAKTGTETIPVSRVSDFTIGGANTDEFAIIPNNSGKPVTANDFEDTNFIAFSKNIYLRDEQIKSAGFVSAYMEDEKYDGSLYKTIYTDDLYDVSVKKIVIKSTDALFAKVYVVKVGPNSSLDDVYQVLKIRGAEGLESEINETDEFGDESFYMNDTRRPNTAFLTVRIGNLIYGFSYPKEYHAQVKNLTKLLAWEK